MKTLATLLTLTASLAAVAVAQTHRLVKDINSTVLEAASYPQSFFSTSSVTYFSATTPEHGRELWKTNGTSAGTVLVKDIHPGSRNSDPRVASGVLVNDVLLFLATSPEHGLELWRTDGSEAGTYLVKDVRPGTESGCTPTFTGTSDFARIGGVVYFAANDGTSGTELWRSDGTSAGTLMVREIDSTTSSASPIFHLTATGSQLFFVAQTAAAGQELWRSDGTAAGTYLVADLRVGTGFGVSYSSTALTPLGNSILFWGQSFNGTPGSLQSGLWISTGAPGSATYLGFASSGQHPGVVVDGSAYLLLGRQIVRTNGTSSGTLAVTPETLFVDWPPSAVGSQLLFAADTVSSGLSTELWASAGTLGSETMLKNLATRTADSAARDFIAENGRVLFHATNGTNGTELWSSDGSAAGTQLVADIWIGSGGADASAIGPKLLDGILHFARNDGIHGIQLWRSDGTTPGTRRLTGQAGATVREAFGKLGSRILYVQDDATSGRELWVSQGTLGDEHILLDLNPGPAGSFPSSALSAELNGKICFVATSADTGYELWSTDGTAAGTFLVADLMPGSSSGLNGTLPIVRMGSHLYFPANSIDPQSGASRGFELWRSDGTAAGTQLVRELASGSTHGIDAFTWSALAGDGVLWFTAVEGATGSELWRSDGTEAGTFRVMDILAGPESSNPVMEVVLGSRVFFSAIDASGGREPWVSDGTPGGTLRLLDIFPGQSSSIWTGAATRWPSWKDRVYFAASNGVATQLWRTDGTPAGTVRIEGSDPGRNYNPDHLTLTQGKLFFRASDAKFGTELHVVDLPVDGPNIVVEQPAGNTLGSPSSIIDFGAVNVGGSSAPREFVIRNTGDVPLTLSSPMAQNGTPWEFPTGGSQAISLQPGESTSFTVSFSPTGPGYRWTVLRVQSNDPDLPNFDISLAGTGVEATPLLVVEYPEGNPLSNGLGMVDFGPTLFSNPMSGGYFPSYRTFTVRNLGTAPLSVSAMMQSGSASNFFSVSANQDPSQPIAPGGSGTFTVQFTPTQSTSFFGSSVVLTSNDPAATSFSIGVTGTGVFPETLSSAIASAGLSGDAAAPDAQPFGDGVENLLKYAFNLNLAGPDARTLVPGSGTAGLPSAVIDQREGQRFFRMEFLRRRGVSLSYTPEAGPSLTSMQPMSGTETVTQIDAFWERVVVEEPFNPATQPSRFARVRVSSW